MRFHAWRKYLLVAGAIAIIGWITIAVIGQGEPGALVSNVDRQRPGTVQFVHGNWVARLPNGEYRVFLNLEPHSKRPLHWYGNGEGRYFQWDFLWNGGSFVNYRIPPHDRFGSPVFGELYSIDGRCVAGPCDTLVDLYVVPTVIQGKRLIMADGPDQQLPDHN